MTVFIATDLDDTWTKTARKIGPGVHLNVISATAPFEPTYLATKQHAWFDVLRKGGGVLLPVTGRSLTSCKAWSIRGQGILTHGGVFSHGADMLGPDGCRVPEFDAEIQTIVAHATPHLLRWKDCIVQALDVLGDGLLHVSSLTLENGSIFGFVLKAKTPESEAKLQHLSRDFVSIASALGLGHFSQKNHLTILAPTISKHRALAFWREKFSTADDTWIGAGDSLQDGFFMASCDWQTSPTTSDWSVVKSPST
jgi:hypothetical protein